MHLAPLPLRRRAPFAVVPLALLAACSGAGDGPSINPTEPVPTEARISLNNDAAALASRVRRVSGDTVPLTGPSGAVASFARPGAPSATTFLRTATVSPPTIAGRRLLASHVVVRETFAYVSYMTIGAAREGAVEVFDISSPEAPRLVSQALFADTDVLSLAVDQDAVYLATATGDPSFAAPAVLERIALAGGLLTTRSTRVGLPSFAATGVDVSATRVFVTSGTGGAGTGGLTVLDRASLARLVSDVFLDARAVAGAAGAVVAVSQGTPARLRLYNPATGALLRSVALAGGEIPESKSTVALTDRLAFVATGEGGVQVVDIASGTVVAVVPRPSIPGVKDEDAVTNAVSLLEDFVFAADGGAGVAVTYSDHRSLAANQRPTLNALGRLLLPESVNFVAASRGSLFVAQGAGGLQVLAVRTN